MFSRLPSKPENKFYFENGLILMVRSFQLFYPTKKLIENSASFFVL
ncbi:hypothetical protein LV84_02091 [Algoriphagus ratkowskyi]|uniref:Uncharacterized protein n=1 Tax=Algoriphagus ratkowskyi TaxID=57028 RepID=A0A2W7T197_9BACT|nr:hypothetical protein LV84_02091 [Algoriphagus ratkowskyi]